jgi:hypothetical protein
MNITILLSEHPGCVTLECQRCDYHGDIRFAPFGLTLVRQARLEAFEHCWQAHMIPAYRVGFGVGR